MAKPETIIELAARETAEEIRLRARDPYKLPLDDPWHYFADAVQNAKQMDDGMISHRIETLRNGRWG